MLFTVFNAFMILVLVAGLVSVYKYHRDKHKVDVALTAFTAIVCISVFSAYILVLGASAAFNELFGTFKVLFSAFRALLPF